MVAIWGRKRKECSCKIFALHSSENEIPRGRASRAILRRGERGALLVGQKTSCAVSAPRTVLTECGDTVSGAKCMQGMASA